MSGINTTGKPNTDDYYLGRGCLFFAELDANDHPKGFVDLGNGPALSLNVDTETLEHLSSRQGLRVVDKEVITSQRVGVTLSLDEISLNNMARFLSGETAGYDNSAAVAGVTPVGGTGNLTVYAQGEWYDLYKDAGGKPTTDSSGSRIYNMGALTIIPEGGGAAFVEGVDFEVDSLWGRIFIVPGGGMAGSVNGTNYEVTIAANAQADASVDEARALTKTTVTGCLRFIAENPADGGRQLEVTIHKVSLKADGSLDLITEQEWTVLALTGVAERNESADPDSPTMTIRYVDQAAA